jgi:hypothetical protein
VYPLDVLTHGFRADPGTGLGPAVSSVELENEEEAAP